MPRKTSEKSQSDFNLRPEYLRKAKPTEAAEGPNAEKRTQNQKTDGGLPGPNSSGTPIGQRSDGGESRMDSREGSFNRTFAEVVASAAQGSSSGPSQICAPKSAAYVPPHLRGKEKGMQKKAKAENLAAAGGPQQSGKKFVPVSAITHPTNRTAPYINTDKKPSEEKQMPFLYQGDDALIRKYGNYDTEETGKWMMFFAKGAELDERWAQAKQLYNEGKLDGVTSMKVSTAHENPRASNKGKGVIIFYCGPFSDKPKMVEIGQNLLAHIPYNEPMAYKSDEQTLQGTRATGIKKNHLYTINIRPFSAAGHKNVGE